MPHFAVSGCHFNKCKTLADLSISIVDASATTADVDFDLVFNRYYAPKAGFHLLFRLQTARVELRLKGCAAEGGSFRIDPKLELSSELEYEIRTSHSKSSNKSFDAGTRLEVNDTLQSLTETRISLSYSGGTGSSSGVDRTERRKFSTVNASRGGAGDCIQFVFEPPPPMSVLIGRVEPRTWFTIRLGEEAASIMAELKVAPDDIDICGVGGIWPRKLPPRKRRLLRALALTQLDYSPFLSKSEVDLVFASSPVLLEAGNERRMASMDVEGKESE